MNKITHGTRICSDEQGIPHTFHYSLTSESFSAGRITLERYGVKVEEVGGESVCLHPVTLSRSCIDALLALLIENAVSPISLCDVLEDWAKEKHLPQLTPQQVLQIK